MFRFWYLAAVIFALPAVLIAFAAFLAPDPPDAPIVAIMAVATLLPTLLCASIGSVLHSLDRIDRQMMILRADMSSAADSMRRLADEAGAAMQT